uniref:Mitochondrial carrier n=1 Tax=Anopheles farauti TaxID=69004 RepID=A0A182QVZ8_9DIPT
MPTVQSKKQQEDDVDPVLRFGFRILCSTALYPLEYAKTLIQESSTNEHDSDVDDDAEPGAVRKAVALLCGVIISHPFHVISIRMMAQFIGREHVYDGLFGSIKEIWKYEGIHGFFSGLIPRLWMHVSVITVTGAVTYLFNKYVGENKTIGGHVDTITHFTVSSIMYPYNVVSTCMAVQGSRLQAGHPPMMDHYINWQDCYARLRMSAEHKRGSGFFFRTVAQAPAKGAIRVPFPELK